MIALSLVLAACSSEPTETRVDYPPLSKFNLDVSNVSVFNHSMPALANSPYAANAYFQPKIADALRNWLTDGLIAAGTSGDAVVTTARQASRNSRSPTPTTG